MLLKLSSILWILLSFLNINSNLIALVEQVELPLNHLMIPTSCIKDYWKNQEIWGEMTAQAIKEAVLKLKSHEINNITEIYSFLAQARSNISQTLNHGKKMGQPRTLASWTMVENRTRYKDFFSELYLFISAYNPQFHTKNNYILFHDYQKIKRSKIINVDNGSIDIFHTEPESFAAIIALAEKLFAQLNDNKTYTPEKIRETINEIYFYIVDAMLSRRGSSSISEMLYHTLEKYFLDIYSYISTSNSAEFIGQRAISPDILAMASPTFAIFNDYFTKHIYEANKHIKITQ